MLCCAQIEPDDPSAASAEASNEKEHALSLPFSQIEFEALTRLVANTFAAPTLQVGAMLSPLDSAVTTLLAAADVAVLQAAAGLCRERQLRLGRWPWLCRCRCRCYCWLAVGSRRGAGGALLGAQRAPLPRRERLPLLAVKATGPGSIR